MLWAARGSGPAGAVRLRRSRASASRPFRSCRVVSGGRCQHPRARTPRPPKDRGWSPATRGHSPHSAPFGRCRESRPPARNSEWHSRGR
jgi:hypothetical protein